MISGKVKTVFRPEARGGDTKYGSRNNKGMMLEREKLEDGEWKQMGDLYSLGLAKGHMVQLQHCREDVEMLF